MIAIMRISKSWITETFNWIAFWKRYPDPAYQELKERGNDNSLARPHRFLTLIEKDEKLAEIFKKKALEEKNILSPEEQGKVLDKTFKTAAIWFLTILTVSGVTLSSFFTIPALL